ncbi:hypothetical protein AB50_4915 [Escherichia coli 6-175-07_S1_C2]|nr:hypothetical protein AB50_4915 [Escherichia coli 6-175-07_S1_C2]
MLRPEADALFIRDEAGNKLRRIILWCCYGNRIVGELCETVVMRLFLIKSK